VSDTGGWRRTLAGRWADAALAVVLFALGQSQVWAGWADGGVGTTPHGHRVARALLMAGLTAPLAWRRRRPLAALLLICATIMVQVGAVVAYVPFLVGLLPMAVANYSAAAHAPRVRLVGLAAVLGAEAVIYTRIPSERVSGEVIFAVFVAVGTWVVGDVVRERLARADRAVGAAHRLAAEREAVAAVTLAEERARIARELHDVIAHSVSLMGVQAGAARTLLDTNTEAARAALLNVEATARSSVGELHRLLGLLRADAPVEDRAPQPGLSRLAELVEQVRSAGLAVELVGCVPAGLPPGVDLAAYRIVQEALTNALKHSGAPTTVELGRDNGAVRIRVRDVGKTPGHGGMGAGHGLIGMRERALIYGGSFEAGPDPAGGFIVLADLPVRTPEAS
jgi:signal transduction histidine kinase